MARYRVFIRRTAAFLLGALLTSAFINDNGVQAAGTGLVNEQGEEIRLESRVNDSILWHVPLGNIEDVYYHGTMLHDEQGNSYILANGSLVSIDLEGRRRWSVDVPRHGIAPRGLVRGEDGTIYVLEVEEFKDDRYTDRTGWITAVDPFDGKIRWQRGMPEGHRLSSNFVTAANSSGIIVVAASTGSLLAFDRQGNWIWSQPANEARSLAVDPTGGFVAVGYAESFGRSPYVVHWSDDGKEDWRSDALDIPVNSNSVRVAKDGGIYGMGFCSIIKWNLEKRSFDVVQSADNELLRQLGVPYDPAGGQYCFNGGGLFKTLGPGQNLWQYQPDPSYTYAAYVQADASGNLSFTDNGGSWHRADPDGNPISELSVRNHALTHSAHWSLANGTSIVASNTFGILAIGDENRPITVFVRGTRLNSEAEASLVNSQTFVPLRATATALGANVQWNGEDRSVKVTLAEQVITLWIDRQQVKVGKEHFLLETAPFLRDEHTMVPLRFLSQALGYEVDWDPINCFVHVR